jgi:hypothetical protein
MLRSDRFVDDPMLEAAAKNAPPLEKGCQGDGVAAMQQALLDLGYDLPISTGNGQKPPDGIFGKETDAAVRAFQADQELAVDGDVGKDTMRALDEECVYRDLKPAIHNVGLILASFSTHKHVDLPWQARRMRRIGGGFGRGSFWHLAQQLKLALIQQLPESKRAEAHKEWMQESDWATRFDEVRRQDDEVFGDSWPGLDIPTGGGGHMGAGVDASPNPAVLLAMLGALVLSLTLQNPRARPKLSMPKPSAAPAPSNAHLWFLAFTLTSLVAAAVHAAIRRHLDAIKNCQAKNAHRIPGCTQAILKFAEATAELQKCATIAQHSGGQFRFPGFAKRSFKALSEYNEALKQLAACLGCGAMTPLSF